MCKLDWSIQRWSYIILYRASQKKVGFWIANSPIVLKYSNFLLCWMIGRWWLWRSLSIFEHGEGKQNEDVSVNFINLWSSHTTGLLEIQKYTFLWDALYNICWNVAKCVHEVGRNQITIFWIQVMFSVFRRPKYDDIRRNHTKKSINAQKTQKKGKKTQNCTTLHCNAQ